MPILTACALLIAVSCASSKKPKPISPTGDLTPQGRAFYRSINLREYMIPRGRNGRFPGREMEPEYITVHSTANPDASAWNHALALRNGKLRSGPGLNRTGFLTWHYTVDYRDAFQHLPVTEQGEHADYSGKGNLSSIGLEICEFRDPRLMDASVDRAARLTAWLMHLHDIKLKRVVPHHHWPRWPNNWHKPCPRIFMTNGKPGQKWDAFLDRVKYYHRFPQAPDRPQTPEMEKALASTGLEDAPEVMGAAWNRDRDS